jgi:hypothetical protein
VWRTYGWPAVQAYLAVTLNVRRENLVQGAISAFAG